MELGYSISSYQPGDVPARTAADRIVERTEAARDAGLDYVETGDSHVVGDGQYLQNLPTAARLAAVFDHVTSMVLLPLYDPVLVAEQAGTVAAFTEEFDLWCAVGGSRASFDAFGVPLSERAPRFEEALALVERLWREDDVTFDGEFYDVEGVSVNPKPASARVCVGGSAEPAVRRAGRLGDAWAAGPSETLADLDRKGGWFEEEGGGDLVVRRDVLALPDGDRARDLARDLLADGYRGWPEDAEWVVAGDASDVAASLADLADVGADEVVVRPMSEGHAAETLATVGEARDHL